MKRVGELRRVVERGNAWNKAAEETWRMPRGMTWREKKVAEKETRDQEERERERERGRESRWAGKLNIAVTTLDVGMSVRVLDHLD